MPQSSWVVLTRRYGEDIRQPSEEQRLQAVDELFTENIQGMTDADYAEHPNAWLRYGIDEGPVFVADASRSKTVTLSKFADQDDDNAVAESTFTIDRAQLLALWHWLSAGEIERIRAEYPKCGWDLE